MGIPPRAVEKDWWGMAVLRAINGLDYSEHILFKGGTSLSKGWNLIERFSEDIDLALDRSFFGFGNELSRKRVTKLRKTSCKFFDQVFPHHLSESLTKCEVIDFELNTLEFERSDTDPVTIELNYKSLTEDVSYLQPKILIEISSRTLKEPFENRELVSFIGAKYENQKFADTPISVATVLPTKTLLEKMFLLHEEFQKPANREIRSKRMSRHLYDILKIMETDYCEKAIQNTALYDGIISHRKMFTNISWVDYSKLAKPLLNFIPPESEIEKWKKDYQDMCESMIYGESDSFDVLISKLKELNARVNQME